MPVGLGAFQISFAGSHVVGGDTDRRKIEIRPSGRGSKKAGIYPAIADNNPVNP